MKQIALFLAIFLGGSLLAQEIITPLTINQSLYNGEGLNQSRASELNDLDSTFIYQFGTIALEDAWDDFSTNKFELFDADYTDAGVTSELFYHLFEVDEVTPMDAGLIFCDSLFAHNDTIKIDAGVEVSNESYYLFTPYDVFVNDLDFYPVVGELVESVFQECYVLIDSIIDGVLDPDQDTVWYNTDAVITMVQDSARVFTKTVSDNNLWIDNYACHNYTFAKNPWSLGVATFDGVDETGRPYSFGDGGAHGVADYLTSRPINLSVADPGSDVVRLKAIYQAQGFGNMPEANDSLLLELYNPTEDTWTTITNAFKYPGDVVADSWDTLYYAVPIIFYQNGFQFRFKNYASLSGALDHWHLDYVELEITVEAEISSFNDVAISYPINTVLKDYTAVPWDHYVANTTGNEHTLTDINMYVYNCTSTGTNFTNGDWEVRYGGILQGGSPFNIPNTASPTANFDVGMTECTFNGAADFGYDSGLGGVQAAFDLKFSFTSSAGLSKNVYKENDTTYLKQRFDNYYSYDDGSAEAAYGVEGTGSLLAYKFEAYQAGELTGILMQFQQSVTDLSGEVFLLTVWNDEGGHPGEIIYQDDYFESHHPEYSGSKAGFRYYTFNNAVYLTDGYLPVNEIFYVGWQKIGEQSLNIGLDWNIDNGDKVFRNTGGTWLTSSYNMSLLIRPVFSTGLDYTLSNKRDEVQKETINLYPNPASTQFTLSGLTGVFMVRVFDMSGRMVTFAQNEHQIDISSLENGVYIVDVTNSNGERMYSAKLIKK